MKLSQQNTFLIFLGVCNKLKAIALTTITTALKAIAIITIKNTNNITLGQNTVTC